MEAVYVLQVRNSFIRNGCNDTEEAEMILKVLADTRQVLNHRNLQ